jgi:hypothetical protein
LLLGSKISDGKSVAGEASTAFLHFVLVQVIALVVALLANGHWVSFVLDTIGIRWIELNHGIKFFLSSIKFMVGGAVAITLFYAIFSSVPAIIHIYAISQLFQHYADGEFSKENNSPVDEKEP